MKKNKGFLKNLSYTLISNIVSTVISMIVTLIVPKIIGVESYGYFQLYMMCITFLGLFHLGWIDGIYLKIGGKKYTDLDPQKFTSQFILYILMELLFSLIIIVTVNTYFDSNKAFVYSMAAVCMVIYNIDIFVQFILLATNRIKQYSILTLSDRILYIILIVILLSFKIVTFKLLILVDLTARFCIMLYAVYSNRKLILKGKKNFKEAFTSGIANIGIGYKVTFGGIAGIFITIIGRFLIESNWGISIFGQVSLSLTLSNLMMVFVNAVSLVIFPLLKRTNKTDLPKVYYLIRNFLMIFLLGMLVIYEPVRDLIGYWLPKYSLSLKYLGIMFPLIIFNSKTSMLIVTFLKTTRQEGVILYSNIVAVCTSAILSIFTVYVMKSLLATVIVMVIGMAIRSIYGELLLAKKLDIFVIKDITFELILCIIFMVVAWNNLGIKGSLIYIICYGLYLILKKNDIKRLYSVTKNII